MNLKEELNQTVLEFNSVLEGIQNDYRKESEELNLKFQSLEQEARKVLSDKQEALIEKANELLMKQ